MPPAQPGQHQRARRPGQLNQEPALCARVAAGPGQTQPIPGNNGQCRQRKDHAAFLGEHQHRNPQTQLEGHKALQPPGAQPGIKQIGKQQRQRAIHAQIAVKLTIEGQRKQKYTGKAHQRAAQPLPAEAGQHRQKQTHLEQHHGPVEIALGKIRGQPHEQVFQQRQRRGIFPEAQLIGVPDTQLVVICHHLHRVGPVAEFIVADGQPPCLHPGDIEHHHHQHQRAGGTPAAQEQILSAYRLNDQIHTGGSAQQADRR